jgi:6-phosphogluconolactonase (cycloisomerase 2 family)
MPYSVHVYAIDAATGALKHLATSPLAESLPYISLDRTGRFLFGASYGEGAGRGSRCENGFDFVNSFLHVCCCNHDAYIVS